MIIFDFPCSGTFREFEGELNGEIFNRDISSKSWIPLNEEDFVKKPKGLRILEYFLGINFIPYPREKHKKSVREIIKGVPL